MRASSAGQLRMLSGTYSGLSSVSNAVSTKGPPPGRRIWLIRMHLARSFSLHEPRLETATEWRLACLIDPPAHRENIPLAILLQMRQALRCLTGSSAVKLFKKDSAPRTLKAGSSSLRWLRSLSFICEHSPAGSSNQSLCKYFQDLPSFAG